MIETEIFLEKRFGKNLGLRLNIEKLFKSIDKNTTRVIMNFEGVEFIGRSATQEYLNQKYIAHFEVIEKNMSEEVEKMFGIILKLNNNE